MKTLINKGFLASAMLVAVLSGCKKDLELSAPFALTPDNVFTDLASYQRHLTGGV